MHILWLNSCLLKAILIIDVFEVTIEIQPKAFFLSLSGNLSVTGFSLISQTSRATS